MGCWNGTCFMSNLPILDGNRIVLIITALGNRLVADDKCSTAFCHPNDNEDPITLPIKGTYDDYGSIKLDNKKGVAERIAENVIGRRMSEILESGHMRDDNTFGKDDMHYGVLIMHEHLYDQMIKSYPGNDITSGDSAYDILSGNDRYSKLLKKFSNELKGLEKVIARETHSASVYLGCKFNGVDFFDIFKKIWKKLKSDRVKKELGDEFDKLAYEAISLNSAMLMLRKSYSRGSGAGSQNVGLFYHLEYNKMVAETANELYEDKAELYADYIDYLKTKDKP